jgi:hypothetical protein
MSVDQTLDGRTGDSPNWRRSLIFYLYELAVGSCAIQQNGRRAPMEWILRIVSKIFAFLAGDGG